VCREGFDADPIRAPSEQRADGVETVRLCGREYADAVLDAGMNLETYDRKAFPDGVSKASRRTKATFVRALADSEGNVDTQTGNVRIFSASYELLLGTKQLLLEFGVSSQIQTRERDDRRDVYVLAITAADSLEAFERHIGFVLDRKASALEAVRESAVADRTILDVIPSCGDLLAGLRDALRLHQSECGIEGATYCDFENDTANVSLRLGRKVLDAFEQRRAMASEDLAELQSNPGWETLAAVRDRYHVSQSELAARMDGVTQQAISRNWQTDATLRARIADTLRDVLREVARTDLTPLRELLEGDVKWRRVADVATTVEDGDDDRIEQLEHELADTLSCDKDEAVDHARRLLATDPDPETWGEIRELAAQYGISLTLLADDLDVDASTLSRWTRGVVETGRFDDVRTVALDRIEAVRRELREIIGEITEREAPPRVYDLTVDGTHNFVANGMVVHNSEDRSAMHQALEQQEISISKAGINATLKSRCSLLGAANPKYGRFDQYEPIGEQIDLEPALISRFDLIFTVTDQPDPDEDAALAEHILRTNYAGELETQRTKVANSNHSAEEVASVTDTVEPAINPDLLRKYIAYAKRTCFPTMTDEAKAAIRDFYVDLRAKGADEDAPVPVTARKLEALVRLAEASARVRLSDTVEQQDATRATDIVRSCLQDIGVDPETGEFDADVIETGTSKSQRDRIKSIKDVIETVDAEYEKEAGAPLEAIVERAEAEGIEESKVMDQIEQLRRKGDLYSPKTDQYKVV
jgi:replicative DNA helicase Mcm